MADLELSEILALMLAAGGPADQLARVRWPLHVALREAYQAAGRCGERAMLGAELELRASSEVGHEVHGADRAIESLLRSGVLCAHGEGRQARLVLDPDAAIRLRRLLMTRNDGLQWPHRDGLNWLHPAVGLLMLAWLQLGRR